MDESKDGFAVPMVLNKSKLMGDYSQKDILDSVRQSATAQTPLVSERIKKQAADILALKDQSTPLIGGENLPLNNQLPTQFRNTSETPLVGVKRTNKEALMNGDQFLNEGQKRDRISAVTPLRDQMSLNNFGSEIGGSNAWEKSSMASGFTSRTNT